jgi:hypothetical protein
MLRCDDVMNPRSPCLCDLLAYEYAPVITKSYTPRSSGARVLDYYTRTSWHGPCTGRNQFRGCSMQPLLWAPVLHGNYG